MQTPGCLFFMVAIPNSELLPCFLETLPLQDHSLVNPSEHSADALPLYLFNPGEWQPRAQGQTAGGEQRKPPPSCCMALFSLELLSHELDQT